MMGLRGTLGVYDIDDEFNKKEYSPSSYALAATLAAMLAEIVRILDNGG